MQTDEPKKKKDKEKKEVESGVYILSIPNPLILIDELIFQMTEWLKKIKEHFRSRRYTYRKVQEAYLIKDSSYLKNTYRASTPLPPLEDAARSDVARVPGSLSPTSCQLVGNPSGVVLLHNHWVRKIISFWAFWGSLGYGRFG